MPEAGAAVRPNAGCPRCGAAFHCGAHESSCACADVVLDRAAADLLRARYTGCLCMACLRALQRGADAGR